MRNILLLVGLLIFVSCNNNIATEENNNTTTTTTPEAINNIDWLLGDWERVGEEEGKVTHEYWNKVRDKEYIGLGCTMVGKDTVWQESMLLSNENDIWLLQVKGAKDNQATIFKLTDLTENSFVCENEENEFPKKIEYYKEGEQLKAKISGGGPEIPFQFKKQ